MQKTLPLLCALLLSGALSGPAARAADYTNSIGMQFNNIPAGRFYMGSCKLSAACPSGAGVDDEAYGDENPQHEVHIRQGFRMGVHEVTVGQFKQYIAEAGRDDLLSDKFIQWNGNDDRAPVTRVSWHDAQDFIDWLNKKEGTRAYRLPSEAEWEYAARAGTRTRYSWGDGINCGQARYGRRRGGECSDSYDGTVAVGSFAANGFGLFDMYGNVWEWVEDCCHDNYEGAPTDGSAWTTGCDGDEARAVVRGGSWVNNPRDLRAANRYRLTPSGRFNAFGFRLVQDLNP